MNRAQRRAKNREKPSQDFVVDFSWRMIMAAAGLVMHAHGMDDDLVGDMLVEIQETIDKEVDAGGSALTIIKKLEDETGIALKRKE